MCEISRGIQAVAMNKLDDSDKQILPSVEEGYQGEIPKALFCCLLLLNAAEKAIRGSAAFENYGRASTKPDPIAIYNRPFLNDSIPQVISKMLAQGHSAQEIIKMYK